MVSRLSQGTGSGRENIAEYREWSGFPPGGPGWSGGPSTDQGTVLKLSQWFGSCWEALPEVLECSGSPSTVP